MYDFSDVKAGLVHVETNLEVQQNSNSAGT